METQQLKIGDIVEAEVSKITDFGAFVKINGSASGLIHISQIADTFVKDIKEHLKLGEKVKARIIKIGPGKKIDLSLKSPQAARVQKNSSRPDGARNFKRGSSAGMHKIPKSGFKTSDFEEKLKTFLKDA